ncbi:MAG: hypothetical protein ACRD15_14570, partial [Vicinamibacterales bacterium]
MFGRALWGPQRMRRLLDDLLMEFHDGLAHELMSVVITSASLRAEQQVTGTIAGRVTYIGRLPEPVYV